MYRTLKILTVAQAFAQTGAPIVVLLGGIVGTLLAPSPGLATLPVALMIVGTASTTIPAALLMGKFGRKAGFIFGASYSCLAGLLAAFAINRESFVLFCLATFLVGSHNAFIFQYRFAVAESVPPEKVGQSLSVLMLAGVAAAFMGPESAQRLQEASSLGEFAGSFLGLSVFMLVTIAMLCFYRNTDVSEETDDREQRSVLSILQQPMFIVAIAAAVAAWCVMSLMMTATPVSMHQVDHFDLADTAWVIQSHIMAMFLPSLFSGFLIGRFGALKIIMAGLALLFACLYIAYLDRQLMHYWWALVLLGIGWNFMFLGGTTLLTQTYRSSERFKVQALNDFIVFSMQAIAALSSGFILVQFGWSWIIGLSLPWLLLLIPVLFLTRNRLATA
ncbi:MAG: MFS transporter [Gammaproteobacteria bacterium]|nr:MFS transporter [Gammaproteobacteria bacterium]